MTCRPSRPHQPLQYEEKNIISYPWPDIYVPYTSFTRYIVEKFLFYSNQIFVIDSHAKSQFTYKHVLLDSLKTAQILRANKVSSKSTIAIIGGNSYEYVCTLFAAFFLEAQIVLIDANASKKQISAAIRKCAISYIAVIQPKSLGPLNGAVSVETLTQQCKNPYSFSFADSSEKRENNQPRSSAPCTLNYSVFKESPINSKILGLQRSNNASSWDRTRIVIPVFRGSSIHKTYRISEYCLMSQLTYATLPQSGFEWNINDIVLSMWPFAHLLGILELLVTFSVGARVVLHRHQRPLDLTTLSSLLVEQSISACILHSSYLLDLIKWQVNLGSLEKILYTEQPIHRNIVSVFRKKYSIHSCRYGYFLLEASGFAAMEAHTAKLTPLPSMEVLVLHRQTGLACSPGQFGKIFIRSDYCSTSSKGRRHADGWVFSGHVGFYDSNTYLQVIDSYCNFIRSGATFISKTLVETVLLSHPRVAQAVAMKSPQSPLGNVSNDCQSFVSLKEGQVSVSEETLSNYLNSYLNDHHIKWIVTVVDRLVRSTQHRIVTRRLKKRSRASYSGSN